VLAAAYVCRVCGMTFPRHTDAAFTAHVGRCVKRNEEYIDSFRRPEIEFGDPELAAFARAEGDVYNRRPGTRRRPR
jgi:hypothetical protein